MLDQVTDASIGAAIVAVAGVIAKMAGVLRIGRGAAEQRQDEWPVEVPSGNNGKVSRDTVQTMLSLHESTCVRLLDQRFGAIVANLEEDKDQRLRIWKRMEEVIERIGLIDTKVSVQAARLDDHLRGHG